LVDPGVDLHAAEQVAVERLPAVDGGVVVGTDDRGATGRGSP
jgi:hypothetical protein